MSAACIVCLGDLGEGGAQEIHDPPSAKSPRADPDRVDSAEESQSKSTTSTPKHTNATNAADLIAHLQPCGHHLHNECLKPWVERANSCPICRAKFTTVDLVEEIDGDVISTYAVQDRAQVAEFDPTMLLEPVDVVEEEQACHVCHDDDHEDVLLICDHCSKFYHTYCVGISEVPVGHWFCDNCRAQRDVDPRGPCPPSTRRNQARSGRTVGQRRRFRNRQDLADSGWHDVWSGVFNRINLDLDFPSDDEVAARAMRRHRLQTDANQREYDAWQHRRRVADLQGGRHSRFEDTAATLLPHGLSDSARPGRVRHRPKSPESEPEENAQAWADFERAKQELAEEEAPPKSRKRKSSLQTETSTDVERPDKKIKVETPIKPEYIRPSRTYQPVPRRLSTVPLLENVSTEPSFLQSLLEEVGDSAVPGGSRSGHYRPAYNISSPGSDQHSPQISPALSPATSNHSSPRALSASPPPYLGRPISPTGLSSSIQPDFGSDSIRYSFPRAGDPFYRSRAPAPVDVLKRPLAHSPKFSRSAETSPSRPPLSFAAKSDVQNMVSAALKPIWRKSIITTDEFTTINRDISRHLYDKIENFEALGVEGRAKWEKVAADEVEQAVKSLKKSQAVSDITTNGNAAKVA